MLIVQADIHGWRYNFMERGINMKKLLEILGVTALVLSTATHVCADTVTWDVSMMSIGDDDVLDTAFGTAQSVSDDTTATGDFQRTAETSAITCSGSPVGGDRVWVSSQQRCRYR